MAIANRVVSRLYCHVFPWTAVISYPKHLAWQHRQDILMPGMKVYAVVHDILMIYRMHPHSELWIYLYLLQRKGHTEVRPQSLFFPFHPIGNLSRCRIWRQNTILRSNCLFWSILYCLDWWATCNITDGIELCETCNRNECRCEYYEYCFFHGAKLVLLCHLGKYHQTIPYDNNIW